MRNFTYSLPIFKKQKLIDRLPYQNFAHISRQNNLKSNLIKNIIGYENTKY